MRDDKTMIDTIKYIHHNPVKRGYVADETHWLYSVVGNAYEVEVC